jgi:membrane protease YdiL (CAAX protease family)
MIRKNNLYILGSITLIGFPLIGFLINWLIDSDPNFAILIFKESDFYAITAGLLFGISIALVAERLSETKLVARSSIDFSEFFRDLNLSIFDIAFLAFAAGLGEEILFRGSIQAYLGIWITSVLFIAIHGYLNIKKIGMFIFGLYLVLFSALLGYLYEEYGIWSSIAAHFSYDFVLLYSLRKSFKTAI